MQEDSWIVSIFYFRLSACSDGIEGKEGREREKANEMKRRGMVLRDIHKEREVRRDVSLKREGERREGKEDFNNPGSHGRQMETDKTLREEGENGRNT